MSGIAGFLAFDDLPVAPELIQAMLSAMSHRGSGNGSVQCCRNAGIGHLPLHSTLESLQEKQPLISPDLQYILSADARIDNRHELQAQLTGYDLSLNSPDSAYILAAYDRWGVLMPKYLIGDFAFVIWDNNKKCFYCARDGMGVRPFFYSKSNNFFAFASEPSALFTIAEISKAVNNCKIREFLLRSSTNSTASFYRDIVRLPPGHYLSVTQSGIKLQQFWSPLDQTDKIYHSDPVDYALQCRDLFREAVRCRLRSNTPVAMALSGGLDSSSIVSTAAIHQQQENCPALHSISAIFPSLAGRAGCNIDEQHYIHTVLAKYQEIRPHFIEADQISPLAFVEATMRRIATPFFSFNYYLHAAMFAKTHQLGAKVFLDGLDGDSILSYGFERFPALALRCRFVTLLKEARALKRVHCSKQSAFRLALRYGFKPLLQWLGQTIPLNGSNATVRQDQIPLNPRFIEETQDNHATQNRSSFRQLWDPSYQHKYALTSPVLYEAIENCSITAASHGVEVRYPFLDRRLIEFCLAIPPEQKYHQGWTRYIMRQAMDSILPPEVQWRNNKALLGINFSRNLAADPLFSSFSPNSEDRLAPYLQMQELQHQYDRFSQAPLACQNEGMSLYSAFILKIWLEKILDK